ncbi:MAG: hypothetical protein DRQ24_04020 [Candidatus Latescibacterota bacterium]|nr:MAG: hypothetical protein DRQ24_04020 [Candidatus Latescibacterota bacterium]
MTDPIPFVILLYEQGQRRNSPRVIGKQKGSRPQFPAKGESCRSLRLFYSEFQAGPADNICRTVTVRKAVERCIATVRAVDKALSAFCNCFFYADSLSNC